MIYFKCNVYLVILNFRFPFVITYLSIKYNTKNTWLYQSQGISVDWEGSCR